MKRRRVLFMRLSQFRLFLRKLMLALVMTSAFGLLFLNKADDVRLNNSQDIVSRILNPIIQTIQLPADGLYFAYEHIKDIVCVYRENIQLREKTKKFEENQNKLHAMQIENALLSELLLYQVPPASTFVTAKIIAVEGDGFSHSLIAYVPELNHVQKGQIVLYKEAVIGRVDAVQGSYVRIMAITDINSKIPVLIERTRNQGILAGNNTSVMNLLFTDSNADIKAGDLVVTSSVGGVFPSDLPLGYISKINDSVIEVQPMYKLEKAEYVKIVKYLSAENVFFEDSL